jgi:hypothetical protein
MKRALVLAILTILMAAADILAGGAISGGVLSGGALVTAALVPSAQAAEPIAVVTPRNAAKQPLQFQVQSDALADGTVRFDVFVAAGTEQIYPRHEARFVIWEMGMQGHNEMGFSALPVSERPKMLAVSSVAEVPQRSGALRYEVVVDRSLLPRISLTFMNYPDPREAAFDGFEIMLGEFAPRGPKPARELPGKGK